VFGAGGSIQLFRVRGIRIGIDISWFFVLFLILFFLSDYYRSLFPGESTKAFALALISALLFFLSVLLHELGHAVVAQRNGIGIAGIDLWMFGGVAKMERDTSSAGEEFRVAIAGPLVTLGIVAVCFLGAVAIDGSHDAVRSTVYQDVPVSEAAAVLGYLSSVNALLLVFNLLPGFPLDGGRIARAIVWWRTGDRLRATRIAARLGRGVSFLLMGLGVLLLFSGGATQGIWLVFIGIVLSGAARQSEQQAEITSRLEGLRVADVMDAEPVAIPDQLPLDRAWNDFFLRYGWPWFPVVDPTGRLIGVVTRPSVEGIPEAVRASRPVASVMATAEPGSSLLVRTDEPLETLLGLDGLQRLGAIMAVDAEGVLRGVVTLDRVRQALRPAGV
jgi:Zn-dependent protease